MPVSQKKSLQQDNMRKLQRFPGGPSSSSASSSSGTDLTFGGLPMPKLEATYEPMIVKEARYIAITMMKVTGTLYVYIIRGVTVHVFEVHAARQRIHLQSVKGS